MDQTREQLEKPPATSTGVAADMKRLKSDTASTAEEVREFIANLKGRSPQEVLGAVSESGLVQATVQATFACTVLLVALTVGPWALKSEELAVAETEPTTPAATPETSENTANNSQSETAVADAQSGDDAPSGSDTARAASAMKIDETVVTDPKTNPLDGNLDKLLDGLD